VSYQGFLGTFINLILNVGLSIYEKLNVLKALHFVLCLMLFILWNSTASMYHQYPLFNLIICQKFLSSREHKNIYDSFAHYLEGELL